MSSARVRFGLFEFDPATGELQRQGVPIHLPAQPARALAILLKDAGRVVSRDELHRSIWGTDTNVDFERGLNFCIGQIRAALGDDSGSPLYIRTAAKRGYQFIAPVAIIGEQIADPPEAATHAPKAELTPTPPHERTSKLRWIPAMLAVLVIALICAWWLHALRTPRRPPIVAIYRFDNETSDPSLSHFTDGLTDNLVAELTTSSAGHFAVIGNAVILRLPRDQHDLRAAQRDLGATYAVLGQVQTDRGQVRILAHLIRLQDQTHLWVFRQNYSVGDSLAVESQAASAVAAKFSELITKDSRGDRQPAFPNR